VAEENGIQNDSHLDDILLEALGKPLVITILAGSTYIALTHFEILPETVAGFAVDLYVNAFFILAVIRVLLKGRKTHYPFNIAI